MGDRDHSISNVKTLKDYIRLTRKSKKEIGASWKGDFCGNPSQILVSNIHTGKSDSVTVPSTGNSIHSHPKGCKNINDCSIQWPSSTDMALYAERYYEEHLCITKRLAYKIKANYMFDEEAVECVSRFYDLLEEYFDSDNIKSHADYDKIFEITARMHKWFTIKSIPTSKIIS